MTKVLLVEDDKEQQFMFESVFNVCGLETKSVSTATEALQAITSEKPSLVLLDVMLQGDNGLDVMEKIKANEETKNIPFFIFTNSNNQEYKERANALGAAAYIVKSEITPQEMVMKIKTFLNIS